VDLVELAAQLWPRAAAGVLGDPGRHFMPFPAPLDFEQMLVPDGDVSRG
jgi:hypothetical protein